jgi:hypothetical protein
MLIMTPMKRIWSVRNHRFTTTATINGQNTVATKREEKENLMDSQYGKSRGTDFMKHNKLPFNVDHRHVIVGNLSASAKRNLDA